MFVAARVEFVMRSSPRAKVLKWMLRIDNILLLCFFCIPISPHPSVYGRLVLADSFHIIALSYNKALKTLDSEIGKKKKNKDLEQPVLDDGTILRISAYRDFSFCFF